MARVTPQQQAMLDAARQLMEEEQADDAPLRERLFYLGAHPEMGGAPGTPFQPQARGYPEPPPPPTEDYVYEMEPLVIEDTRPKYTPAYGPSPSWERARERARESEGGLSSIADFAGGFLRGAGSEAAGMIESQVMGGLGVVDPEFDQMAKDWRQETEQQEEELQSLLAGDPELLDAMQREAKDLWSSITGIAAPAPSPEDTPPKDPTARSIRRAPPTPPAETGEQMGEQMLRSILVDQGIMFSDLRDYGQAYPLATLLTLSPAALEKIAKLPGMSKKAVVEAQERLKKLLENRSAKQAEELAKRTEKALMEAKDKEGLEQVFRQIEENDGISMLKARSASTSPSFESEFNLLVDNTPYTGPVVASAASQAETKRLRELFGLPNRTGKKGQSMDQALENAKLLLVTEGADVVPKMELQAFLDAARKGEHILTADQQFAGLLYVKAIGKQKDKILDDLSKTPAINLRERKRLDDKMSVLLATQEEVMEALEESGSAWGRAGRGRQMFLEMFDEITESKIIKLAESQLGRDLSLKEADSLKKRFNKANKQKKKAKKAIEKADERLEELKQAEEELNKALPGADRRKRQKARAAINKERKKVQTVKAKASQKAAEASAAELFAAQPWWWRWGQKVTGTSRALQAAMDASAAGRQAIEMFKEHPWLSLRAFKKAARATWDPAYAAILQEELLTSGYAKYADRAGLYIADVQGVRGMSGRSGALTAGEEAFVNNAVGDIPVVGGMLDDALQMSERNYSTMLNQIRASVFDKWTRLDGEGLLNATDYMGDAVEDADKILRVSPEDAQKLARIINYSTGRGDLSWVGPKGKRALSTIFFAPRFAASRFQSPIRDTIDIVSAAGNAVAGQPLSAAQKIQLRRYAKQLGANLAINSSVAMATSDAGWEQGMAGFFDSSDPGFLSVVIRDRDTERIIDTSGGKASTWRYLPGLWDLFVEEGEAESPRIDRLISNKVVGPIALIGKAVTGKGYRGQRLWDETAGIMEKASVIAQEAALLGVPITAQELGRQLFVYTENRGLEFTERDLTDLIAPAAMNFLGLSNYERLRE